LLVNLAPGAAAELRDGGQLALASEGPTPAKSVAPSDSGHWLFLPRGNRLLAATLSLGLNGTGQLYNGENEKGLGMMAGWLAFTAAYGFDELIGTGYLRAFAFAANAGIKVWSVADAWQQAGPAPAPSATPAKP
jgi:hypothetical protein